MARLDIRSLTKSFDDTEVIKGVDLSIEDREFCVFLGPSGCGKSTMLRLIAGLEDVSSGQILLDGKDITALPAVKRDLAMVFQSYALYPHMNIRDNMSFSLKLAKVDPKIIEEKVQKAARTLGLEKLLERKPAALSGGQRQRVAIGRAIVRAPRIFLFDEPLSNLDAALRGQTRLELARLHQDLKATMIYVTHDQVEAMTLADKVIIFNGGHIEQSGSPLELYRKPANRFVAGFLGVPQMSFVDAVKRGGELEVAGGGRLAAPPELAALADGSTLSIGLRAEQLSLCEPAQAAAGSLRGTLAVAERLGSDTYAHVSVPGAGTFTVRCAGGYAAPLGSETCLQIDPLRCHYFDGQGKALRHPDTH